MVASGLSTAVRAALLNTSNTRALVVAIEDNTLMLKINIAAKSGWTCMMNNVF